jgi:hypothetical protein
MRSLTSGLTDRMLFTRAPDGAPAGAPAAPAVPPPAAPPPAAPAAAAPPAAPAAPPPAAPAAAPAAPAPQPTAATAPTAGQPAPQPSKDGAKPGSDAAPSGADASKKEVAPASADAAAATGALPDLPKPLLGSEVAPPEPDIDLGKLPEGVLADEKQQAEFKALCKEAGINSAAAQKLIAFSVKTQTEANAAAAVLQRKAYAASVEKLQAEARQDARIGGQNFEPSLKAAQKVLQLKTVAQEVRADFTKLLFENPHFGSDRRAVAFFASLGKSASEDSIVGTGERGVNEVPEVGGSPFSDSPGGLYEGKMGINADSSAPLPSLSSR